MGFLSGCKTCVISVFLEARTQTEECPAVTNKGALHIGETVRHSRVERRAVVVEVDRYGTEHIFGVRFSFAPLTMQT